MWADFDGTAYTRDEFAAHIATLRWNQGWKPQGITLHNTAAPTLAQWAESGERHKQRIANLQSYYEGMGWHSGPHFFISRNFITGFANILKPGVHSRCYNATHLGIEMVGDYNAEPFDTGDGAMVRDNAVFALATLFRAIGVNPATLVFHKECKADNHDCPGKNVSKGDVMLRVAMLISGQSPPQPAPPAAVSGDDTLRAVQTQLAALGYPPGPADGLDGPKTQDALRKFRVNNAELIAILNKEHP